MRPVLRHPDLHPFSGLDMAALKTRLETGAAA